jgi:hypothetical protein
MANLIEVVGLPSFVGCFHELGPNLIPGPSTPTKKDSIAPAARIHPQLRVIAPAGRDESLARACKK